MTYVRVQPALAGVDRDHAGLSSLWRVVSCLERSHSSPGASLLTSLAIERAKFFKSQPAAKSGRRTRGRRLMAHASDWRGGARLVVGAEISATLPSRPTFGRDTTPNPPYTWAVPEDLDRTG